MFDRRSVLQGAALLANVSLPSWAAAMADDGMIVHRNIPLNSEPRPDKLTSFITDQSDFYVRNHGTTPAIDAATYKIRVGAVDLTLSNLAQLPKRSVTAVMQCAGNRRADMARYKRVSGDAWQAGAIGNAEWSGVSLADVLNRAGVGQKAHVAFTAHDEIDEEREHFNFGVSIPMAKALASETILATSMNGQPLTPAHGFPLRLVTPGFAGVRSPKWLTSISVQDQPSDSRIQQKEYRQFAPKVIKEKADFTTAAFIDDMPLNSAILQPIEGATVKAGRSVLRGYAICTMHRVAKVEVSVDGGKTWSQAELKQASDSPWAWVQWSIASDLKAGDRELIVRAFDDQGSGQPEGAAPIFNFSGYLMNAWHRVTVHVEA